MNDYQGSIAQENVIFSTEITTTTTPGDNFYKLGVYLKFADIGTYLVDTVLEGAIITLTASTFAAATKGMLKDMLTAFFAEQSSATVYVLVYGDTQTLATLYGKYKSYAYWVAMCSVTPADVVALATLQKTNSDLTAPVVLSVDTYSLTTPTDVVPLLNAASLDAWVVYDSVADTSQPALYQLGRTLGYINESGTPVGNSCDFVVCTGISASGVDGSNLDSTAKTACEEANIGYFNTLGNGTGSVVCVGGVSLLGKVIAAEWIVAYCNYVNRIKVAETISQMNTFRTNATYTMIKQVLVGTVGLFTDNTGMGRLTNFVLTAPEFNALPDQGGDNIVVPNAWTAEYVDNVRRVTVQGILYIAA